MYFKYTPGALILSALHLNHSDAPSRVRQNLHFDTPSRALWLQPIGKKILNLQQRRWGRRAAPL